MATFKKPRQETGRAVPDPNDAIALAKAERAREALLDIWVDTPRQRVILNNLRSYMRVCSNRRPGAPINGRRLSQFSQAGKSAIVERLIAEVAAEEVAGGREPNPFRIIHLTIDKRITIKMLYQDILNRLGDDFEDVTGHVGVRLTPEQKKTIKGNSSENIVVKQQRIAEWVRKLGVELIVVDEIQRLVTKAKTERIDDVDPAVFLTPDAEEVSSRLQTFLDRGIAPIAFIGDETSEAFFDLNRQFRPRLEKPLELTPLNPKLKSDRRHFKEFCIGYDSQLQMLDIVPIRTCLSDHDVLAALITASGGHIGRAARIIEMALPAALERGAATLERYDLSNAVRDFAIGNDWVDHDPFSLRPVEPQIPLADLSDDNDAD
ncbi:TniB family NTP-binding protein [Sphingomonas sp. Marseille-Q8236]